MIQMVKILFKLFVSKTKFNKIIRVNSQHKELMNNLKEIFKRYLSKIMVKIV